MRVLATIGFSFSAGVFLAALLPWDGWQLYAAACVILLALVWLLATKALEKQSDTLTSVMKQKVRELEESKNSFFRRLKRKRINGYRTEFGTRHHELRGYGRLGFIG